MIDFFSCTLLVKDSLTKRVDNVSLFRRSNALTFQRLKVPLFLAGATLLFFWPVWIAGYRFPIGGGDLWGQLHPVWSYVAQWLRRGVFPLWHTGMMAGDPIVAEGQYGLFNPLNWPMFLFSPIPTWVISLRGMATLWLAGVGMYFYLHCSPVWRLRGTAAIIGALAYMFADPFVAHLGHPQFNDALAWLPWTLWAVDGAMRHSRRIPLAGGALALVLLAGHGQASLYTALIVGLYALWQSLDAGWKVAPRRVGRLLLVGVLAACLAAPGILPGLERLPYTERALVPFDLRRGYEFPPQMLVDLLAPAFHGRGVGGFWPSWNRVESAYIGAVALYLAVLGLLSTLRQRRTWFLLVLGVLAYLFALGYQGPLYAHVARLPLFADSWKTARAIFGLSFALASGAALGAEALYRGRGKLWSVALLAGSVLLWFAAPSWSAQVPAGIHRLRALGGLRLAALLALPTALLFLVKERRWAWSGLTLLLLGELILQGTWVELESSTGDEHLHAATLAYLRDDPGWFRVDVDGAARGLWSPATLQAAGFEVPQGSGNPMELFAFGQFYWAVPYKGAPAYQLFGAKYIVVPKGAPPGGEGIWPVFTADPLVDIHLNTNALTRVWLVYDTLPVSRIEEAYTVVFAPDFVPARMAVVENGPDLEDAGEPGGAGALEVLAYGPNRVRIFVRTAEPALLVLSDIFYPGWRASLDGEPTPLYKADGIFRGVFVPAGEHRVEMRFFPASLRLGLGLAMAGVCLVMVIWGRRRANG